VVASGLALVASAVTARSADRERRHGWAGVIGVVVAVGLAAVA
jgi:hypothetical protein